MSTMYLLRIPASVGDGVTGSEAWCTTFSGLPVDEDMLWTTRLFPVRRHSCTSGGRPETPRGLRSN